MHLPRSLTIPRLLSALVVVLIWRVTFSVVLEYRNYWPPNFRADFLLGREAYFWGPYRWAFYVHLISGPISLLLGTVLISGRFRRRFPAWHRRLGRIQGVCVLLFVAPSGLWMAFYAATGAGAGAGLGALSMITAVCIALGWRAAVRRDFARHQVWMTRTFALLCSAVVIRMIGGAAEVLHVDALWVYPVSTWLSWLVPLAAWELYEQVPRVKAAFQEPEASAP